MQEGLVIKEDTVKAEFARYGKLKNELATETPIFRDIRNFLSPRTARFNGENNRGRRMDYNIINTAPTLAVRTLPAGLQSGASSPVRPWFRVGTPDPEMMEFGKVKEWCYDVERIMRYVFANSNLYDKLKSNYHTLGTYGTSQMLIDEDEEDVIRAHDYTLGTFMISQDAYGRCDTMYRDVDFSVRQWVEKFTYQKCPEHIRKMWDQGMYESMYPVIHAVRPNMDYKPSSALKEYKKYIVFWMDPACNDGRSAILLTEGYNEKPIFAPRWEINGESTWGDGCGIASLGDNKQLQHMEKRKLQGIDKNTNPTMLADASMRNQRIANLPGETVYQGGLINGKAGYVPAYAPNPYLNELREEIAVVSDRIDEAFYKNLFLMVAEMSDQPNITATQINTMREEKLLMMGPVLERMNNELFSPIIDRVFGILFRRGMIPPPPKELQGMPLKIEYISVLAQAQKAMGIGNIERFSQFIGGLMEFYPEARHKYDIFQAIDAYGDGVAIPPNLIRSDVDAQKLADADKQAMQAQTTAEQLPAMAGAMKTASETPLQGGQQSALDRAMEIAGG